MQEEVRAEIETFLDLIDQKMIALELEHGEREENISSLKDAFYKLKNLIIKEAPAYLHPVVEHLHQSVEGISPSKELPDEIVGLLFLGLGVLRTVVQGIAEGRLEEELSREVEDFLSFANLNVEAPQTRPLKPLELHALEDKESFSEASSLEKKSASPKLDISKDKKVHHKSFSKPTEILKIRADKVDLIMNLVGELAVACADAFNHPELADLELEGFQEAAHRVEVLVRQLQDASSSLRLVPVTQLFQPMRRIVRDICRLTGKKIRLVTTGEDTELDRVVIEHLQEAMVHLVRNAADHGIELPEERERLGKPLEGEIVLSARQQGGEVVVSVSDDGRGLSRERILRRAREMGLIGQNEEPPNETLWEFIFEPGFSTAERVTEVSGRGVGMDVVREAVRAVRGRVEVSSSPGQGTEVQLYIPLTLAFLDSLIVEVGEVLYAVPTDMVREVLKPSREKIIKASADGSKVVKVREELIPIAPLEEFFGGNLRAKIEERLFLILHGKRPLAVPVDEIRGQQQVTVKPLQGLCREIRAGAGWALLASGETALVIDPMRLE